MTVEEQSVEGTVESSVKRLHHELEQQMQVNKRVRVNEQTMDPIFGVLKVRLDSSMCHLPLHNVSVKKNSLRCALHRWVDHKYEIRSMVMVCTSCNIPLCISCYKPFHSVASTTELKNIVNRTITSELKSKNINTN